MGAALKKKKESSFSEEKEAKRLLFGCCFGLAAWSLKFGATAG
jgi:hypothetical protein